MKITLTTKQAETVADLITALLTARNIQEDTLRSKPIDLPRLDRWIDEERKARRKLNDFGIPVQIYS